MIKLDEVVIVEGKYDKIRLESLIDALIIPTDGFAIFKNKEKMAYLRRLAEVRGLLVLTDGDGAGFLIRNHIAGSIPPNLVKHAYIPDILGKERRKTAPSKEGKLGVEGMESEILLEALRSAGVKSIINDTQDNKLVTRQMFYEDGLIGGENSAERRKSLLVRLNLPEQMSTAAMLSAINALMNADEYHKIIDDKKIDIQ